MLHERARRDWGYGVDEQLTQADLIAERYRGIRPAFGIPHARPQREAEAVQPARAERAGIADRELRHDTRGLGQRHVPRARGGEIFQRGRHGRDQVEDYARRKGVSRAEAERWLVPNLGYEV